MRVRLVSILFALLAVTGCGTTTSLTGAVTGPEAQRTVYAINAGYIAALQIAVKYESKPRCNATVTMACSDPVVVDQLRKANTTAKAALDAAQSAVRATSFGDDIVSQAMQAAQIALAAFSVLTNLPGVK